LMTDPAEFFAGRPLGVAVYERVREIIDRLGHAEVRTTRSQVAFRRRRGFAWLWRPGQYLARPDADVVLSVAPRPQAALAAVQGSRPSHAPGLDAPPRGAVGRRSRRRGRVVADRGLAGRRLSGPLRRSRSAGPSARRRRRRRQPRRSTGRS